MAALFFSTSLFSPNPRTPLFRNPNPKPLRSLSFPTNLNPRIHPFVAAAQISDEWGEKSDPDPEPASEPDPPSDQIPDEWGEKSDSVPEVGPEPEPEPDHGADSVDDGVGDLKRMLVDTVYGTDYGFTASAEVRAEVFELVSQLEAKNPTPAPTEATEKLDGNWILLYTAFSELLPLVALGSTPLVKVKQISQAIDTKTKTIINATTLSSPFATFSFSATASFEVRSPSRIQVEFKEGAFQPPDISSTADLPENIDIFGQKIDLSPVRQSLTPLQDAVANIARTISGQPPLKIPIPGNRAQSWLLTTYLDEDFRVSRGDVGLFVLAKEGSSLLDQS